MDGVIHVIETVLLPPTASEDSSKPQEEDTSWITSLVQLFRWKTTPEELTVESLMEILNPLLEPSS
jgi:hypothetical protein